MLRRLKPGDVGQHLRAIEREKRALWQKMRQLHVVFGRVGAKCAQREAVEHGIKHVQILTHRIAQNRSCQRQMLRKR
jgi:hypothetical protein